MRSAGYALAGYTAITLVITWPLVRGLGRDVAWDLGDSLLNMWILAWDAEQLLAILRGDFSRLATFFDGNIFHPAPLTLAYSEHLVAQAIQILPVYALTQNPILCYNLLFLSTFVLSGLGMYLFVRELTGRPTAAFVAGLLFAFAPYRFPQSSHLQVLSSQWMPFALFGFHRYFMSFDAGRARVRPLAGAAAALILQSLSCGYHLLYFSPFAAGYALWEIAQRGRWRRWKVWAQLSIAALVIVAATAPFLLPYAAVIEQLRFERSRAEVIRYSADVHSYATAFVSQPVWGDVIRAYPKPEGDLFPGFVPLLLAAVALLGGNAFGRTSHFQPPPADSQSLRSRRFRLAAVLLLAGSAIHFAAALAGLIYRRIAVDLWLFDLQITNINQLLLRATILGVLALVLSPAARRGACTFARGPGFFLVGMLVAIWLSLGPVPQVQGRLVEIAAPYGFLYEHVPGYDGVRVPARLAMIVALMLAVLGGFGAARLGTGRRSHFILLALSGAFLAESLVLPFVVNGVTPPAGYSTPEARVYRPQRAPNVYKEFGRQAPGSVLAELPLGEADFDLRAVYYSTAHWRPLLNGYSGYYPPHYGRLALALSDITRFPDVGLEALRAYGTTHVIVHEGAFLDGLGASTTATLRKRGATELYREGSDVLLELP